MHSAQMGGVFPAFSAEKRAALPTSMTALTGKGLHQRVAVLVEVENVRCISNTVRAGANVLLRAAAIVDSSIV